MAYLIGLPASEIPAIEVVRGDLLEVVPASYGVHSQAYHFWDGPGRKQVDESALDTGDGASDGDPERVMERSIPPGEETNFYENYAEDTKGKRQAAVATTGP